MSTKPKKKEKKTLTKTGKRDWSFYAIIICLLILAIPVSLIGFQALSAWSNSRKPIVGDRLDHRYDNVITKEAISMRVPYAMCRSICPLSGYSQSRTRKKVRKYCC